MELAEMQSHIITRYEPRYSWKCPLCDLIGDEQEWQGNALSDLKYHIEEDHKGEL